jgi:glycerol transport system ATP-binding protein
MARITLVNLAHSYLPARGEDDFALKEMDHVWEDGGAYALLGASGCGKTTLLNIISGLVRPSQGRVLFDDRDVTDAATAERNIAQVFQFPVVYDTMTVRDNLAFPLRNRGMDEAYVAARVQQIAQDDRHGGHARPQGARADGGCQAEDQPRPRHGARGRERHPVRRAADGDRPAHEVGAAHAAEKLHREFGHTMIYVTHDQTEALTFADKVVVMHDGRVVQMGTPQELFETPAHTFVGYFIGSPGHERLPAEVRGTARLMWRARRCRWPRLWTRVGPRRRSASARIRAADRRRGAAGEGAPGRGRGPPPIVRAEFFGRDINIILPEGERIWGGHDPVWLRPRPHQRLRRRLARRAPRPVGGAA